MPPKNGTLKKPTPSSAPLTKRMFGRGNVCRSSASQPSAGGVAAAEHSGAASERSQAEVKVIGAAPARTKSSHEEALATEQRRGERADDSAAAAPSAPWHKKTISSEEVEVIGAAPAQTESSDEEAPATEQRRDRRAGPKPPAVAPPAKLQRSHMRWRHFVLPPPPPLPPQPPQQQQQQQQQRRGGWFQKCQELSDAVLNGDHDRAMELAYCYRGKKHELEKLEKAQDQGYYSKK